MTKPVRLALLTAGLALFVWFIQRTGWEAIHQTFQTLGWLGFLALIPYTIVFSIDTLGWRFTFGPTALRQVSYWTTWRVRLIGEAINNVIPTLYVGGEAAKVFLLKRQGVSKLTATSAAVRSKTAQSVAQSSFIALGALVTAVILPPEQATIKWIFAGIALAGFGVMGVLFRIQRHGMVNTLVRWIRKLGFTLDSATTHSAKIKELDEEIHHFYKRDRIHFQWCTATYFTGWIFDTVEIMVVTYLLGYEISWPQAFAIEAFIGVARGFNVLVPGALGIQDFSIVGLFALFGLNPEFGVQYAIARRGRDVIFAGLGWSLLSIGEVTWQGMQDEIRE